jgi:GR25 family glycosyltransferase involved in LPS biosynthesis
VIDSLHVYVINLDRRSDRLEQITKQLDDLGIPFERFKAVDYLEINSTGTVACAMSHKAVLQDAVLNGYHKILVLEDDALFINNFKEEFNEIISKVPDDWQMIHLGAAGTRGNMITPRIQKSLYALTSHAIAIDQSIFQRLIDLNKEDRHVDEVYGSLMQTINAYTIHPSIVKQSGGYSDVSNRSFENYEHIGI